MNTRKVGYSEAIMILAAWVGIEFPLPPADKSEVEDRMSREDSIKEAERLMKLVDHDTSVLKGLSEKEKVSSKEAQDGNKQV